MTATGWTESELISLQNAYDRDVNGHDDVVALIRGVRAVLALHEPEADPWRGPLCSHCCEGIGDDNAPYPCATVRALNLDPIGDTP